MSWVKKLSPLRVPPHPSCDFGAFRYDNDADPGDPINTVWYGDGIDAGLFCFRCNYKRVIASQFGCSYVVNVNGTSTELKPTLVNVNGFMSFQGGSYNLYYDYTWQWVVTSSTAGMPQWEAYQYTDPGETSKGGQYIGTTFWYGGWIPYYWSNSSLTMYMHGAGRGSDYNAMGSAITLTAKWDYWQLDNPEMELSTEGVYQPKGNATGTKIVGTPSWQDMTVGGKYPIYYRAASHAGYYYNASRYYWKYFSPAGNDIVWNNTANAYVLGTYNSSAGWWQSATGAVPGQDWTLTYTKPAGSKATGTNKTFAWRKYVLSAETENQWALNAAIWR